MSMIDIKRNFSRGVLIRLGIVVVLAIVVLLVNRDFILNVYLRDQLTDLGLLINGGIVGLFLLGMARIVAVLLRYVREEHALYDFVRALDEEQFHPAAEISPGSIVARRYQAVLNLSRDNAPINHGALASTLVARESTAISLPKFVNNILILTGVFGTIVSLSIALVGASDILDSPAAGTGSMGMVIHGMSTALSTTMTAIICYLIYGYFYLKLTDTQTHLLSEVEQVTTLYLLPRYAHTTDNLVQRVSGLVKSLSEVAESMRAVQADYVAAGSQLNSLIAVLNQRTKPMSDDLNTIKRILRDGFRLPEPSEFE